MVGPPDDPVLVNLKPRLEDALAMGKSFKWEECTEALISIAADLRSSKTLKSSKAQQDQLAWLERVSRNTRKNANSQKEINDILDRSNGSPEPPADPDVWSKPSPPATVHPKQNSVKKGATAPRRDAKSTASVGSASTSYGAVEKADKTAAAPASQAQSILPPNRNGEIWGADGETFYDTYIIEAVKATMELNTANFVTLDDVIGMDDVKRILHEAITLPLVIPDFFKGLRRPWKAMCLAGPPGTGKTLIARAIASASSSAYFSVSAADLSSKWRGDSEKILRLLFELARFYAPSIIFMDEVDSLGGQRGASGEHEASRRFKSELLVQMDGIKNKFDERRVFVLAATNIPWELDDALRRRFEKRIFVPLPNREARKKLVECSMKETHVSPEVDYDQIANATEGFSGADVVAVCRAAAYNVLRRFDAKGLTGAALTAAVEALSKEPVTNDDFDAALKNQSSSVNVEAMKRCEDWCASFGARC